MRPSARRGRRRCSLAAARSPRCASTRPTPPGRPARRAAEPRPALHLPRRDRRCAGLRRGCSRRGTLAGWRWCGSASAGCSPSGSPSVPMWSWRRSRRRCSGRSRFCACWSGCRRGGWWSPSRRLGWPVRTAMVVVAGAYFFSGLAKLLHAGPGWVTSGNLRWVLYASSDQQPVPNPYALFVADRPVLAHLLAAATLAVELGFPLVLWRPRLAWLFLPAAVALHAGIWLAMRLDYSAMAATALLVVVDWPSVLHAAAPRGHPAPGVERGGAPGGSGGPQGGPPVDRPEGPGEPQGPGGSGRAPVDQETTGRAGKERSR